jgi:hypothetical protein
MINRKLVYKSPGFLLQMRRNVSVALLHLQAAALVARDGVGAPQLLALARLMNQVKNASWHNGQMLLETLDQGTNSIRPSQCVRGSLTVAPGAAPLTDVAWSVAAADAPGE